MAIVCWMFYAFVFSVPLLHTIDVGEDTRLPKIVGYLFVLAALLQPHICFRRFHVALWCFAAYIGVYALLGAFQPDVFQDEILERGFSLIQLLVMAWIAYNLLGEPAVARGALIALVASGVLVAVLQVTGVAATDYGAGKQGTSLRVSALGQNANLMATTLSLALIALLNLASNPTRLALPMRYLIWSLMALLGLSIVLTGSRGGLVALMGGLLVFMLFGTTPEKRLRNFLIGSLVIAMAVLICLQLESARIRWEETFTAGDTAHRNQLFSAAWEMFEESPIVGWGPMQNMYELGWRVHYAGWVVEDQPWRDTHNLVLWVLTQTGLLGGIPFFAGIGFCLVAAWKARQGTQGVFPLAMAVTLLISNQSGNWIHSKLQWLILAYILASGTSLVVKAVRTKVVVADAPLAIPSRAVVPSLGTI
jgi:O-antigen ligase